GNGTTGNINIKAAIPSGSGAALCLNASDQLVSCTTGTGGISGSGNIGQLAFFSGSTSNISSDSNLFFDNSQKFFGIGIASPSTVIDVEGANSKGNALAIFNQQGANTDDILTASSSGATKFTV